jgi:hypothetical protein
MASDRFMISALLAHAVALELSDHRDTQERATVLEQLCCEGNAFALMLVDGAALARQACSS